LVVLGIAAAIRERGWKTETVAMEDAAAACRKSGAELLALDLTLIQDVAVATAARRAVRKIRVMATIGERNSYLVRELQAAGATVIAHRGTTLSELETALSAALTGGAFLCSMCTEDLAGAGKRRGLSPRETEVLRLLGYGDTNRVVAAHLKISEKTVEAHRANIKRKVGARGLSDLVRFAISTGLVDTKDPIPAS
jgi:DNA-binding NarL/FixJ family response regulator